MDNPSIDPAALIQLIQSSTREYKLDGPTTLRILSDMKTADERIAKVSSVLDELYREV